MCFGYGSHTHTHKILNQLDENELLRELKESKEILEDLLNAPVDSICYPEGKFDKKQFILQKKLAIKSNILLCLGFLLIDLK